MSFSAKHADELTDVIRALSTRNKRYDRSHGFKDDAVELLQAQAQEIVRLERKCDDLMGVEARELFGVDDGIRTEADAVAFITEVSNNWEARKRLNGC